MQRKYCPIQVIQFYNMKTNGEFSRSMAVGRMERGGEWEWTAEGAGSNF